VLHYTLLCAIILKYFTIMPIIAIIAIVWFSIFSPIENNWNNREKENVCTFPFSGCRCREIIVINRSQLIASILQNSPRSQSLLIVCFLVEDSSSSAMSTSYFLVTAQHCCGIDIEAVIIEAELQRIEPPSAATGLGQ
jgi:hypothetical protein